MAGLDGLDGCGRGGSMANPAQGQDEGKQMAAWLGGEGARLDSMAAWLDGSGDLNGSMALQDGSKEGLLLWG